MGIETRERGGRELESGAQVISGQLGKTIQRLRKAYNLSLSELAEQSGVAKSIISQIERNETNPTLATIWRLSQALDGSIALTVSAHQSLGLAALLFFGSEELKAKYLPRCARGESFAAFALVEIGAGSDAGAIQTRADRDGDAWVVNGEKVWVTNGAGADLFTPELEKPREARVEAKVFEVTRTVLMLRRPI